MKSDFIYVPIVKWKKGEQEALKHLTDEQKNKILPIIEIVNYEDPKKIINDLKNCYINPVYIDTVIADENDRDYLLSILDKGRENNLEIYPVCYIDDLADLFIKLPNHTNRVSVKIPVPEDVDGPSYKNIFPLLKKFQTDSNVLLDIILDLNLVAEKREANRQFKNAKEVLDDYLLKENFYNLIILSVTSFPESLSSIPAGGKVSYSRFDILIYEKLLEKYKTTHIKNKLVYSDYGVTKYTDSEINFSILRNGILPKIRYTLDNSYRVLKGERDNKTRKLIKSYIELAKEIVESDYYYGENFSYGDLEIKERALGLNKKGAGNHTNWVTISANHHIAVVIEQLSTLI